MKYLLGFCGLALLFLVSGCAVESGYGGGYGVYGEYPEVYTGYGYAYDYPYAYAPYYPYYYHHHRFAPYDRDHYFDRRHYWDRRRYPYGDRHHDWH